MGVISEEFFPTPYSVVIKMIEPYGYNLNKRSVLVHGSEIKAYSKKDALKRYNHLIKIK